MKRMIALILFVFSLNLTAATLDGITFPDKTVVEGKELVLNGIGIRKATFLKIKVYYGALYIIQKSKDTNSFLASPSTAQIVMHFVRAVDAKKLQDAFLEGMEAANKNHASFKTQMYKFNSYITDVVKGDLITISFPHDGVIVTVKGKSS